MTDDGSSESTDGESSSAESDTTDPGGGPTRVVSDQSVDDILDSLESTSKPDREGVSDSEPTAETIDTDTAHEPSDGDTTSATGGTDTAPELDEATGEREESVTDGLSARVDSGTVTGADVRAAEAGEGREKTPAVDEIDLSLEDLDDATGSETGDESPGTESVQPAADENERGSSASDDDTESSPGLLARLTRLFSR